MRTEPGLRATLGRDVEAARERDPAARSTVEIVLAYPGLHAVWGHRIAHLLWVRGHRLAARLLAEAVHVATGVDIHPGAVIGAGLFIDHATGVVIGETAEVGDDVTLYQGVTLGGTSLEPGKRHPTIGHRVTLGAGAKVLGPVVVGDDSRIGANAVVVRDVPPDAVVVGVPGQVIARSRPRSPLTGIDDGVLPDLVGVSLGALQRRVDALEEEVHGRVSVPAIRPSDDGVWRGEDFSI
ncbi:MAG: serine O-acetyltransferase [Actinomycetota bacterium]|nr:serine O-acetyltransferase [Actinomycetota bacterium]